MSRHEDWLLTPECLAIHPATATAVVADLHLGYISARRQDGEAVPHFGESERLECLAKVFLERQVKTLVIAGDAVESAHAGEPLLAEWVSRLHAEGISVHLTPGNHDERLGIIPLLQLHPTGFPVGDWVICHDAPIQDARRIVQGHLHPCIRSSRMDGEAACYLHHETRLVLPAWCEHAAGVNVLGMDDWQLAECSAIVREQVMNVGLVNSLRKKLGSSRRPYRIGFGLTGC